ncbi:MAG: hypothetical protein EZS28_031275 [Streblomastix strix]|uniref:Uncharacterized protein n=1 Tax=Streblomastix strix TaxID=222440 RepID=A0A5J4US11_9EUKA|nr:MAG: hypothetical protein EZS28_031275 [Streblomastix strix]
MLLRLFECSELLKSIVWIDIGRIVKKIKNFFVGFSTEDEEEEEEEEGAVNAGGFREEGCLNVNSEINGLGKAENGVAFLPDPRTDAIAGSSMSDDSQSEVIEGEEEDECYEGEGEYELEEAMDEVQSSS